MEFYKGIYIYNHNILYNNMFNNTEKKHIINLI